MKLNRKQLLEALSSAVCVIDKKSPVPIVSNVLVNASLGSVEVVATDLRSTVATVVTVDDPIGFCANAGELLAIVGGLSHDEITITVDESRLKIVGGGAKFTMAVDNPKDFPAVPSFDTSKAKEMDASAIASAILGTSYAVSYERPHISGVFVTTINGALEAVATDGQRMAVRKVKVDESVFSKAVIPTGAANSMAKILAGLATCSVCIDKNVLQIRAGGSTMSTKLVESDFVPYEQFFGKGSWKKSPAVVNRAALLGALKRALIIRATDKTGIPFGDLNFSPDGIEIVRQDQSSKIEETVECSGASSYSTHLNLRFVFEAVDHIIADEVEIHTDGDLDQVNIRDKSGEQVAVIMPARK